MPKKIALFGNGCVGKTTAMFNLMSKMKLWKEKVGYCADLSRFITFSPELFDTLPECRLHIMAKQMAAETEQMARKDADWILTERTVMDWHIYYLWTCKNINTAPNPVYKKLAEEWAKTYDLIFYLNDEGIEFVNDGFRPPSTKIRDEVSYSYRWAYETMRQAELPILEISHKNIAVRVQQIEDIVHEHISVSKK